MTGEALRRSLKEHGEDNVFAVVATGGTTNYGVVDEIDALYEVAAEHELWVHVDGAYGLAGLCAPSVRHLFNGIENVDSLIVDPHKWFFAPFDACALIYRDPRLGKAAHTQTAGYLEAINNDAEWNPERLRRAPLAAGPGFAVLVLACHSRNQTRTPPPSRRLWLWRMPQPRASVLVAISSWYASPIFQSSSFAAGLDNREVLRVVRQAARGQLRLCPSHHTPR